MEGGYGATDGWCFTLVWLYATAVASPLPPSPPPHGLSAGARQARL